MSSIPNCYEIAGQEAIEGIPLFTSKVSFRKETPFSGDRKLARKGRVLYARPRFTLPQSDSYIIPCNPEKIHTRYWIVYIEIPALDFGGQPFLDGLNLWPGGEWHNDRPLWREGHPDVDPRKLRQTLDRAEIWILENHEQVLLIDRFGGVRALRLQYGQLQFSQVGSHEMADYICKRGESMTTHPGALWALKNLERLQEGFPAVDFGRQLDSVRRRLDSLEVKIR